MVVFKRPSSTVQVCPPSVLVTRRGDGRFGTVAIPGAEGGGRCSDCTPNNWFPATLSCRICHAGASWKPGSVESWSVGRRVLHVCPPSVLCCNTPPGCDPLDVPTA